MNRKEIQEYMNSVLKAIFNPALKVRIIIEDICSMSSCKARAIVNDISIGATRIEMYMTEDYYHEKLESIIEEDMLTHIMRSYGVVPHPKRK